MTLTNPMMMMRTNHLNHCRGRSWDSFYSSPLSFYPYYWIAKGGVGCHEKVERVVQMVALYFLGDSAA